MNRKKFYIIDCYNHILLPQDNKSRAAISLDIYVDAFHSDAEYLEMIRDGFDKALKSNFNPDFIIYIGGSNVLSNDKSGELNISRQGLIDRDEMVFRFAMEELKKPIVMLLGHGFQEENAMVTAESIRNILDTFHLKEGHDVSRT